MAEWLNRQVYPLRARSYDRIESPGDRKFQGALRMRAEMCLAIPGKVVETFEQRNMQMARVQFGGIVRDVCLDYVPNTQIGEYVLVHVGFAISKVDEAEAERTYQILMDMDQLTELEAPVVEEIAAGKKG